MQKLTRFVPVFLGFGLLGCPANTASSFENSSGQVDDSLAALSAGDPQPAFDAMDQIVNGSGAGDDADAGSDESGKGDKDGKGHRLPDRAHRGPRPSGRGHGIGLLVWYADLDALKVCQDLRTSCAASADTSTCAQQVKDCVRPVLEQAFKALCDEQVAACDAKGGSEQPCEHIRSVCSTDLSNVGTQGGVDDQSKADGEGKPDGEHPAMDGDHGPGDGVAGAPGSREPRRPAPRPRPEAGGAGGSAGSSAAGSSDNGN